MGPSPDILSLRILRVEQKSVGMIRLRDGFFYVRLEAQEVLGRTCLLRGGPVCPGPRVNRQADQ
jgi:hypothetical protein